MPFFIVTKRWAPADTTKPEIEQQEQILAANPDKASQAFDSFITATRPGGEQPAAGLFDVVTIERSAKRAFRFQAASPGYEVL